MKMVAECGITFLAKKLWKQILLAKLVFSSYWEVRKNQMLNKYKKIAKCWIR